jgi:hypothetical protein
MTPSNHKRKEYRSRKQAKQKGAQVNLSTQSKNHSKHKMHQNGPTINNSITKRRPICVFEN